MMNWIYYQLAMYYLRKASNVSSILSDDGFNEWDGYMKKSRQWIVKVKLT